MAIKKVKKASTLTGLVIILVLVMGTFIACYNYLEWNVNNSGETFDERYAGITGNITDEEVGVMYELDNNVKAIQSSFANVTEATSVYSVAWNGLKGLGLTLKLPITFVTTGIATFSIITAPLNDLPGWVIVLVSIGITASIVLLVLSILKGDPRL